MHIPTTNIVLDACAPTSSSMLVKQQSCSPSNEVTNANANNIQLVIDNTNDVSNYFVNDNETMQFDVTIKQHSSSFQLHSKLVSSNPTLSATSTADSIIDDTSLFENRTQKHNDSTILLNKLKNNNDLQPLHQEVLLATSTLTQVSKRITHTV